MEFTLLLVILVTIVLSGFFSGSEIAFVTANRLKIEIKHRQKKPGANITAEFIRHPEDFLTTTLVGNNLVNILYSTAMSFFLILAFEINSIVYQTIISTAFILIFGELIPKSIFKDFADELVIIISYPLRGFYYLMYPLVKITRSISLRLVKLFGLEAVNITRFFGQQDIEFLLEEGLSTGTIDENESELIENVFELKETKVRECMIPRTDIISVEIGTPLKSCMKAFIDSGYSKLPVYEENIDNIVGIVFAHDLFKNPTKLSEIMRPVMLVPEFKRSGDLLKEFKQKRTSVAIVIDEFGGTAGLVTMEDLIEELVGDIQDEFDVESDVLKQLDEKTWIMSGRVLVEELIEEYQLDIEEGDFETIGGFIIDQIGRIPITGEKISIRNFAITIIKATKKRIELLKLQLENLEHTPEK